MVSTQSVLQKAPYSPTPDRAAAENDGRRTGKLPTPTCSETDNPDTPAASDRTTTMRNGFVSGESSTAASHHGSKDTTPHPSPSSASSNASGSVHEKSDIAGSPENDLSEKERGSQDSFQDLTASTAVTIPDSTLQSSSSTRGNETFNLDGGGEKGAQLSEVDTSIRRQSRENEEPRGQAEVTSTSNCSTNGGKRKLVAERTREANSALDGDAEGDQDCSGDDEAEGSENAKTKSRRGQTTKQSGPAAKRQKTFVYKNRDVPATARTPRRREPPKSVPIPKPLRSMDCEPLGLNQPALFTRKEFAMLAKAHGDRLSQEQLADIEDEDGIPITENQWSAFDGLVCQLEEKDRLKTQTTSKVWKFVGAITVRPQFSRFVHPVRSCA